MDFYQIKIASGPDIGLVQTLLIDGAIVPSITASQLGIGRFFNIPVVTKVSYANAQNHINETECICDWST